MPRGSKRQDNGVPTDFFSPNCNTDAEPRVHGGGETSSDTYDIEGMYVSFTINANDIL